MKNPTFATHLNAELIEDYYQQWLQDPQALDSQWTAFFEGFELGQERPQRPTIEDPLDADFARKQACFTGAIYAYRALGHTQAHVNPLSKEVPRNPRLNLDRLGFSEADLKASFDAGNFKDGGKLKLEELIRSLEKTYSGSIGIEYLHLQETAQRRFLQALMEPIENQPKFSKEVKIRLLDKIIQAETFEYFLHTQYIGQKRFGLEGGETMIAALDYLLEIGPDRGVEEIVMGMAHRGRLNVLTNILGKSYEILFHEFSPNYAPDLTHGDGDVKYHLGYDSIAKNSKGQSIILQLAANPSHLEAVNPVVEGRARARQRIVGDTESRKRVIPLLIHGDAAFAGQGIVAEVLNFSQLKGYTTGGTIHFVINNQIGFTTGPGEARSTLYCTDVAKMIEAPIFHVNGDDPIAVAWTMHMALEFRQQFGKDVVIDMYCYRRHGHNESDEPAFTQPDLYKKIKNHPLISETYARYLRQTAVIDAEQEKTIRKSHKDKLKAAFEREKLNQHSHSHWNSMVGSTATYQPDYHFNPGKTQVSYERLEHVANALTTLPESFNVNPKVKRILKARQDAFEKDTGLDWGTAEALAWGTLMMEGIPVRLSGQDCARGTFSHRHAILVDVNGKDRYIPLMHMDNCKAMICIHNSLLSEAAVLGFDFGYSLDYPQMLCIWEAQFGDFANGAQVIIDQFITASESKWQRISGLVMLLPHGYEGQGSEHSSARLERFLQLCAEDNIQVCNLTTPAQYFHVLRRQMHRDFRKPLILMAPKSLLRHKACVSKIKDFTDKSFQCILDDDKGIDVAKRLILCSGKVYYDLIEYRKNHKITDTAIIRLEQLYPLDREMLKGIFQKYTNTETLVWCQEEPKNMGAWSYIAPELIDLAGKNPLYAARKPAASPAVGSINIHKQQQAELIENAFTL